MLLPVSTRPVQIRPQPPDGPKEPLPKWDQQDDIPDPDCPDCWDTGRRWSDGQPCQSCDQARINPVLEKDGR